MLCCNALGLEGAERRTSHVFKGTTLAWVGKRAFGERDGSLLGHRLMLGEIRIAKGLPAGRIDGC